MGRERSAFHRGPELFPSNEGRIHLRRPTLSSHFSLAIRRRTIHGRMRRQNEAAGRRTLRVGEEGQQAR